VRRQPAIAPFFISVASRRHRRHSPQWTRRQRPQGRRVSLRWRLATQIRPCRSQRAWWSAETIPLSWQHRPVKGWEDDGRLEFVKLKTRLDT